MDNTILVSAITAFATTLASKGAEGPAHTLDLLWKVTFGRFDEPLEKYIAQRNGNLQKYAEEIAQESAKIPDNQIKSHIDVSLVGPALEASKYYIGNAALRKMFAKLIAASMDKRHDGEVHHAYVEIIKQMNPIDAEILVDLADPSYLLFYALNGHGYGYVFEDLYMSDKFPEPSAETALAISNLERLGLVHIYRYRHGLSVGTSDILDPLTGRFKKTDYYKALPQSIDPYFTVDEVSITTMGNKFKKVCL